MGHRTKQINDENETDIIFCFSFFYFICIAFVFRSVALTIVKLSSLWNFQNFDAIKKREKIANVSAEHSVGLKKLKESK